MTSRPLHIGIAGPIATRDVAHLLDAPAFPLPPGCEGAPVLATLIEELLRQGHRVSAFTVSNGMPLRADARVVVRGHGLDLYLCPNRPRAWPPNGRLPGRIVDLYAFERRGLRAAIEAAQPDVVHAHWSYEFAWAALQTGLPHVVTCHDSPVKVARFYRALRHGGYRWLRAAIAWHVLRRARSVTTVSPYMLDQVQPLCRVPVSVVPNPIRAQVAPAPGQSQTPPGERIVMVSNGWGALKNSIPALLAFVRLSSRRPNAELHVYGHGFEPAGPAAAWWDTQRCNARAVFHGFVAHDEVLAAMANGTVLLHPSLEESFGAVLAEAMARGLPVVAGAASGAVPWVVGDAGLLVDVRSPVAMADALEALLADAGDRLARGARGRSRAASAFAPRAVADRYVATYVDAIAGQATGPAITAVRP